MMELAKEVDDLASDIVVSGMVPDDVSLRQVVIAQRAWQTLHRKKRLHTMIVFDYADKKKLLSGPLSWPTELPAIGYVPKTNP